MCSENLSLLDWLPKSSSSVATYKMQNVAVLYEIQSGCGDLTETMALG